MDNRSSYIYLFLFSFSENLSECVKMQKKILTIWIVIWSSSRKRKTVRCQELKTIMITYDILKLLS